MFRKLTITLSSVVAAMNIGITEAADQLIRHTATNSTTITPLVPNTGSGNPVAIEIGGLDVATPSYVVLEFAIGRPAVEVVEITAVTLELSHQDGTSRAAGTLNTYFPLEPIDPNSLVFDTAFLDGIGEQFDVSPLLSSIVYNPLSGTVKEKAIQDLEAVKDGIRDYYLDDPEQFRIVIVPGSREVAAMFAGVSDPATAPTLLVEYIGVPEPASAAMLMTAGAVACMFQRRSSGAVMDPLIALALRLSVAHEYRKRGESVDFWH